MNYTVDWIRVRVGRTGSGVAGGYGSSRGDCRLAPARSGSRLCPIRHGLPRNAIREPDCNRPSARHRLRGHRRRQEGPRTSSLVAGLTVEILMRRFLADARSSRSRFPSSALATIPPSPPTSSHPEGHAAHHRLRAARRATGGAGGAGADRQGAHQLPDRPRHQHRRDSRRLSPLELEEQLDGKPWLVVARFDRKYVDANRSAEEGYESEKAKPTYDAYHSALAAACKAVKEKHGRGLLLDIHGQGEFKDAICRGTRNGKTVDASARPRRPASADRQAERARPPAAKRLPGIALL